MVDGRDEVSNPAHGPSFAGLVENIELHMADIEIISDEVRRVQELISETIRDGESRWKMESLREATERIEKRVMKWLGQLRDGVRVMRDEMLRHQGSETREAVKEEPHHSRAPAESPARNRKGKESGLDWRVLTGREKEVLKLVAEGNSSRSIAAQLFISVHTVDRHRANIMGKLNLRKATDLVKYAISQGMLVADPGSLRDE
jgi:DNA-binding CsgD family transcriptional regulator